MKQTDADMLRTRARRLISAANELLSIARDIDHISAGEDEANLAAQGQNRYRDLLPEDHPYWLELARRTYADRRRRDKLFQPGLFGEPAWDILLDLFISAKEGKKVSVTSACIGSAVPTPTALRWIAVLESQGHALREDDPKDARRAFLHLSADAYARMIDYFAIEAPSAEGQLRQAV